LKLCDVHFTMNINQISENKSDGRSTDIVLIGFAASALFWGLLSMFAGLSIAMKLLIPETELAGQYLSFGRFRVIHTHLAIFGFSLSVIFTAIYHSMPALLRTPMYSRLLGMIHLILYNIVILTGTITLSIGINQGKEYAEMEWPLDILFTIMWVVYMVNFFATIIHRREKQFYVSIWFYIGFTVTLPVTFIANNLAIPVSFWRSYSLYAGINDANIQWWYGHNAVAFIFTVPFLGLMYYYLPIKIKSPIYSHRLSIAHFWSIIFLYIWTGPHHLLYSPVPEWVQNLGVVMSLMLIIPSWIGVFNGFFTIFRAKTKVEYDYIVLLFLLAMVFYTMTTLEGSLLAIKSINASLHYTDWMIGHVHAGALGWVSGLSFAMFYILIPKLVNKPLYSMELVSAHFWITLISAGIYVLSMWMSGISESVLWSTLSYDKHTKLLIPLGWSSIADILKIFRHFRAGAGGLFMIGYIIFIYNIFRTVIASDQDHSSKSR
jgi:cytochrome c oxidase cbb3-type subunit I